MEIKRWSLNMEEMSAEMNRAKEAILTALETEGLLKGTAEEIGSKYAIVLTEDGMLGRWWKKFMNYEKKKTYYVVVKHLVDKDAKQEFEEEENESG